MKNIRIKRIVSLCNKCENIADIGTDHGKTIIELLKNDIANNYFACDINKKPLESAKKNISLIKTNCKIEYIISDGLEKLDKNLFTSFIITGMGFDTIKHILNNINDYNYNYLIISPQTELKNFEKFTIDKNLMILNKEIVFEDDKYYFIYKLIRNDKYNFLEIKNNNTNIIPNDLETYILYLNYHIKKLNNILNKVSNINDKYNQIKEELDENKRILESIK